VLWLLGGGSRLNPDALLNRDIWDVWQAELSAKCLQDPARYVVTSAARADGIYVTVGLVQLLRDVVAVLFGETTPRVAVVTQEYIIRRPLPPDPAVETEVLRNFLEYGFQAVDLDTAMEAEVREVMLQSTGGGSPNAFAQLAAALPADILVTGESFAEENPRGGAFHARVELKVIEVRTGRILGSWADPQQTVNGPSPNIAAKHALQHGAGVSAPRLTRLMLNAFGKPITRVRLNNVRGLSDVSGVKQALQQALPGCTMKASLETRGQKNAIIELTCKADAMDIGLALEECKSPRILVDEVACRYIVAVCR